MNYNVKVLQALKLPNGEFALTSYVGIHENVFVRGYTPEDYITLNEGDTVSILGKTKVRV